MPLDFVCKPHPGSLQPLPELAPARDGVTVAARFEEAVADVDVLLYDFPATSKLAVVLCTDRSIVDRNELEAAICNGPTIVDPGYFRRLFLGGAPR